MTGGIQRLQPARTEYTFHIPQARVNPMPSLVLEVQRDCLNHEIQITDVLRKALVIAKKLDLADFAAWIEAELYGYADPSKIPLYRVLPSSVEVLNPYRGWQPVIFQSARDAEHFSRSDIVESVSHVEGLSQSDRLLEHAFGPETTANLMRSMEVPLLPKRRIGPAAMNGIVEAVRTEVLQWCLRLEKDGILGEGLTFSEQERAMAGRNEYNTHFHIENMSRSQIQSATSGSSQMFEINAPTPEAAKEVLRQLREHMDGINLKEGDRKQVVADAAAIEIQLAAPKPQQGIVREGFRSIRNILEGTGGSIIASGLIYEITRLLQ